MRDTPSGMVCRNGHGGTETEEDEIMERERKANKGPAARHQTDDDELMEFEQGLMIDRNGLDDALIKQPELFFHVADRLSLAVSRRDGAKHELELKEAEIDGQLRQQARDDERKITEREIEAEKLLHPDVINRQKNFIHLTHMAGRWQALQMAFSQRSYVLKDLVALHLKAYFAEENASGRSPSALRYEDNKKAMREERESRSR